MFYPGSKKIKIKRRFIAIVALVFSLAIYAGLLWPGRSFAVRVTPKRANYYLSWEISYNKITELSKQQQALPPKSKPKKGKKGKKLMLKRMDSSSA